MRILGVLIFSGCTVIIRVGALHGQAGRVLDFFNNNNVTIKLK
jgi:ribosomal protein L24